MLKKIKGRKPKDEESMLGVHNMHKNFNGRGEWGKKEKSDKENGYIWHRRHGREESES